MSSPTPTTEPTENPLEVMRKAVDRAQKGDKKVLPTIRRLLERPGFVDRFGGDLARQVEAALIGKFGGNKNLLWEEVLPRKLEQMRDELCGPTPTPLEHLLVNRIVTCWLHLHHLEFFYAQPDGMSLALATYYQRCLDRAQKRYLSAIKTLAVVRKLAIPVLQVNIARKQVNVGHSQVNSASDG